MPFIPHTPDDVAAMLARIGAPSIESLFAEIPPALLQHRPLADLPAALSEMEALALARYRSQSDGVRLNFIGAGAYEHFIPAAVWQIASRGEFYSAYTPYQAEASQGTLQVIYEWQSLICELTAMQVANGSLYDGASALAEAALMTVRRGRHRRILLPETVHPHYQSVVRTILGNQDIEIVSIPFDKARGALTLQQLQQAPAADGLVLPQINFFGIVEDVHAISNWAVQQKLPVIALCNPLALAVLSPPGEWPAAIACGEAQPLGLPLSYGGPYLGYLACREEWLREIPGRIAGRSRDAAGREGFTLTLQAREQHIRRAKATSNICTNQGWMVVAATIYLSLMGPQGLAWAAETSCQRAHQLSQKLLALPGVSLLFSAPFFHEFALKLPRPAAEVVDILSAHGVVPGLNLGRMLPDQSHALLVCATETKSDEDIDTLVAALQDVL